MSDNHSDSAASLEQHSAEKIAQILNVLFNCATFYGADHPTTQKNAEDFAGKIEQFFKITPLITLIRSADSLYIEKWCVDLKMNVSRLISVFRKAGIESISFERGMSAEDVKRFISVFSDQQNCAAAELKNQQLHRLQVTNIRFNYVFYQKVTKDEAVVAKESYENVQTHIQDTVIKQQNETKPHNNPSQHENDGMHETIANHLNRLFTLYELVENPDETLANTAAHSSSDNSRIKEQLQTLHCQIGSAQHNLAFSSVDEMMESMLNVTTELKQRLAVQKEMGKITEKENSVLSELDTLSFQTVVMLILQEYRKGVSTARLAYMVKRIVPDRRELKSVLPFLKKQLLAEGMTITQFYELVNHLSKDLESENMGELLELSAESMGVSNEEIVHAINQNPQEAVKLIVLASEIQKYIPDNAQKLSQQLTDYIESVSSHFALKSREAGNKGNAKVLERVIREIETQLTGKLKTEGVSKEMVAEVEQQLAQRFPRTLKKLQADWIVNIIGNTEQKETFSIESIVAILDTLYDKKHERDAFYEVLKESLHAYGFDQKQIQTICSEIQTRLAKKRKQLSIPKNILSSNNMSFFLQRYSKECLRYGNPFSCLLVSLNAIRDANIWREITYDDLCDILPSVCQLLKKTLRDLDIVGVFDTINESTLLVIMPMTRSEGAVIVKSRLRQQISKKEFLCIDTKVQVNPVVSVLSFDASDPLHKKKFKELIHQQHMQDRESDNPLKK